MQNTSNLGPSVPYVVYLRGYDIPSIIPLSRLPSNGIYSLSLKLCTGVVRENHALSREQLGRTLIEYASEAFLLENLFNMEEPSIADIRVSEDEGGAD